MPRAKFAKLEKLMVPREERSKYWRKSSRRTWTPHRIPRHAILSEISAVSVYLPCGKFWCDPMAAYLQATGIEGSSGFASTPCQEMIDGVFTVLALKHGDVMVSRHET